MNKYIVIKEAFNLKIGDVVDIDTLFVVSTYGFNGEIYTDGEYTFRGMLSSFDKEYLDEYFISLADWREQQIKSILE